VDLPGGGGGAIAAGEGEECGFEVRAGDLEVADVEVAPEQRPRRRVGIGRRDVQMEAFVNSWIELKRNDGTLDRLYRHWILGADAVERGPRWSIMRNVLHWLK